MTCYTYKQRTLHHRKVNRHYRQLVLFLCGVITVLIVLLITAQNNMAHADELVLETYQSVAIQPGDSLWGLAEQHKLPEMTVEEYITEVRRINHLRTSDLVSGEYLILPIYTYESLAVN